VVKIMLTAFGMVFLAELGDKTQLAILALAGQSRAPWAVLLGAGSALLVSTVLAVTLGYFVFQVIPTGWTRTVHYAAGVLFILIGFWTLWKA
jgi:putative Ca2+/H+ antiporter (TMEM165/GDT1 family)